MNVIALLRPEQHYAVSLNGRPVGTFRVESRWEGWMKLVDKDGQVVIAEEPAAMAQSMASVFGHEIQSQVLKASPSLLASLSEGTA